MNFIKAAFIACVWAATAEASTAIKPAPDEEVCGDACVVVQGVIIAKAVNLNLELDKIHQTENILLGILTATSGEFLAYKKLFTHQLNGSEAKDVLDDFLAYGQWALGASSKCTGELAKVIEGNLSEDEKVELVVEGNYNQTREATVSIENFLRFITTTIPRGKSFAGKIQAIYQREFEKGYQPRGCRGRPDPRVAGQYGSRHHDTKVRHHEKSHKEDSHVEA